MSSIFGSKFVGALAAMGLYVLTATNAHASFTTINAPAKGEVGQGAILANEYGGSFSANGVNFSNGSITATRVVQEDVPVLDILSAKAIGSFAAYSQGFGYSANGSVTNLFNVTGKKFNATGSVGVVDLPSEYNFVRTGQGSTVSSDRADNADGKDHLVTYLLTGNGVKADTYVLFWEDKLVKQGSDFDFNDLAVEVRFGTPTVVPLPTAAWSGLATLAGGALMTGVKKARRKMA